LKEGYGQTSGGKGTVGVRSNTTAEKEQIGGNGVIGSTRGEGSQLEKDEADFPVEDPMRYPHGRKRKGKKKMGTLATIVQNLIFKGISAGEKGQPRKDLLAGEGVVEGKGKNTTGRGFGQLKGEERDGGT